MKLTDSSVICLLVITWIFIAIGVLGAESEISRVEKQIADVYAQQEQLYSTTNDILAEQRAVDAKIEELQRYNRVQDYRLATHRQELDDSVEIFIDLLKSQERLEEYCKSLPDNALGLELSDQDIRDIAALVYLEAGSQSYRCQKAIASVIFNRMIRYNMTAHEAIYQAGVFSPASRVRYTTPSASCIMAVRDVLESGCSVPSNVVAFRNGHYHTFGRAYCSIDGVYFTAL